MPSHLIVYAPDWNATVDGGDWPSWYELMLEPRSVNVSSTYRSGGAVLQPGIRRSCQRTATTCVICSEVLLRHNQPDGIVTGRLLGQAASIGMSRPQVEQIE